MAAHQPYTERFLSTGISGASIAWYVPAGKRAIVMSVLLENQASGVGTFYVQLNGVNFIFTQLPALSSRQFVDLRLPAYAGEFLAFYLTLDATFAAMSGYLFDDAGGKSIAEPVIEYMPIDQFLAQA